MTAKPKVESVEIVPEWENTLQWMAENMAQHGFLVGSYVAMASILDIARFLARSGDVEKIAMLDRVIDALSKKGNR